MIVSALLSPGRTPDLALTAVRQRAIVLVDDRIEAEYRSVLARPKLRLDVARRTALLTALLASAERVDPVQRYAGPMIDGDDRMFVEVALSGRADAIITGNAKHFPSELGVEVIGPTTLLARLSE